MKLTIEKNEFTHLKEKSAYNYNYYKNVKDVEILEICHEDYNFYEYRLINGEKWELLGCSYNSLSENTVVIDFKEFYT